MGIEGAVKTGFSAHTIWTARLARPWVTITVISTVQRRRSRRTSRQAVAAITAYFACATIIIGVAVKTAGFSAHTIRTARLAWPCVTITVITTNCSTSQGKETEDYNANSSFKQHIDEEEVWSTHGNPLTIVHNIHMWVKLVPRVLSLSRESTQDPGNEVASGSQETLLLVLK